LAFQMQPYLAFVPHDGGSLPLCIDRHALSSHGRRM
jgi:hypothetical protein